MKDTEKGNTGGIFMGKTKIAITLAKECAKLDPAFEKSMADEGLTEDLNQWPEY